MNEDDQVKVCKKFGFLVQDKMEKDFKYEVKIPSTTTLNQILTNPKT